MKTAHLNATVLATAGPQRQRYWDWRAAANFIGGGSGTGLLVYAAVLPGAARLMTVLGIALVCAGLGCVWLEIGRPWRALNVLRHPGSWMTYEAWVLVPLLAGASIALRSDARALHWCVAAVALTYLYCQARMLGEGRGIPAWRHSRIVPLWIASGLAEGSGLGVLVQLLSLPAPSVVTMVVILIVLACTRMLAFAAYQRGLAQSRAPREALAVLARFRPAFLGANALVAGCAMLAALTPRAFGLLALSAFLSTAAGWWLKYTIVICAAYQQGFALPVTPERGSGGYGPGTQPGW